MNERKRNNELPEPLAEPSACATRGEAFDTTIAVTAYRDSRGNPACARNFETGEVCVFYRTQRFGCHETYVFGEKDSKYMERLQRRSGETGH